MFELIAFILGLHIFNSQLALLILTFLTLVGRIHLYFFSSQKANKEICDLISMNGTLMLNLSSWFTEMFTSRCLLRPWNWSSVLMNKCIITINHREEGVWLPPRCVCTLSIKGLYEGRRVTTVPCHSTWGHSHSKWHGLCGGCCSLRGTQQLLSVESNLTEQPRGPVSEGGSWQKGGVER